VANIGRKRIDRSLHLGGNFWIESLTNCAAFCACRMRGVRQLVAMLPLAPGLAADVWPSDAGRVIPSVLEPQTVRWSAATRTGPSRAPRKWCRYTAESGVCPTTQSGPLRPGI
jgi:hypothetical protein